MQYRLYFFNFLLQNPSMTYLCDLNSYKWAADNSIKSQTFANQSMKSVFNGKFAKPCAQTSHFC